LDVRYWHKADIGLRGLNVSFGVEAGIIRAVMSAIDPKRTSYVALIGGIWGTP
jgi:hypothetical protein